MANWKAGSANFDRLKAEFTDIASEADGWDPASVSYGSDKKLPWKCTRGHSWIASVSNRSGRKSGYPFCSGKLPIVGETDFLTVFPEIASEACGWDPAQFTYGSNEKSSIYLWLQREDELEMYLQVELSTISEMAGRFTAYMSSGGAQKLMKLSKHSLNGFV